MDPLDPTQIYRAREGWCACRNGTVIRPDGQPAKLYWWDKYSQSNIPRPGIPRYRGMTFTHQAIARTFVANPAPNTFNEVDHINRDPVDNRADNLRWVNHALNMMNKKRGDVGKEQPPRWKRVRGRSIPYWPRKQNVNYSYFGRICGKKVTKNYATEAEARAVLDVERERRFHAERNRLIVAERRFAFVDL
jgi:hypothetical protein